MVSREPESAGVQRLSWLLLALGLAACVWLVRGANQPPPPLPPSRRELTEAVPEGPALLVTLDVTALDPNAARKLLQAGGERLLGLRERCGFEPLLALRKVAVAVPPSEGSTSPDFAVIAETTLEREEVLRCAETVIRERGGAPARSRLGAFESVRDRKKPLGEVAIRDDGLFVLSGGEYFRAVLDAASGAHSVDEAARLRSAVHTKLRDKLGKNQLVVSALTDALLPLPGVQALGVGLNVQHDVELRGVLYCASASDCRVARDGLDRLLADAAQQPEFSGVTGLRITESAGELDVGGRLPIEQLGKLLSQLLGP